MRSRGFSLIELMTVIAIIGILSSVVIAGLGSSRAQGRDSRRIADVAQIQLALEQYRDICKVYPSTWSLGANNGCPTGVTFETFIGAALPVAPAPGSYTYLAYSSNAKYVVAATLETGHKALSEDLDGTIGGVGGVNCDGQVYCKGI